MAQQRKKKNPIFGFSAKADNDLSVRMMMGASPQSIGADLRAARLARGESQADVAHQLCLRESYIEAIETGNFAVLPGVVYAVGFLRSYARYLQLDADELIQRFKEEVSEIPPTADLAFLEPVSESRVPRGGLVAFAVLLAVIAYAGWYYLSTRDMTMADLVPAVPEQFAGLVAPTGRSDPPPPAMADYGELAPPGPGDSADSAAIEGGGVDGAPPAPERLESEQSARDPGTSAELATTPPEAETGAPGVTAANRAIPPVPSVPPSDGAAQSDGAAVGVGAGPHVYGEGNIDSRIMLRAVGDSWVQVRAADETLLMTRIMRPGDSYRVPNQPGLKLMTGNAGVLEIFVDGQPAPMLGPPGSVKRNVALEPDRLKAGTATMN